jgi:hypothetical protein
MVADSAPELTEAELVVDSRAVVISMAAETDFAAIACHGGEIRILSASPDKAGRGSPRQSTYRSCRRPTHQSRVERALSALTIDGDALQKIGAARQPRAWGSRCRSPPKPR